MSDKLLNKVRDKHEFILKLMIFLSAITLIVFLFPREGKFKYEFQKNKAWAHQDLFAPFDFAILKSNQEIEKEIALLKASNFIYFKRNLNVEKLSLSDFNVKLNELINENNSLKLNKTAYLNIGTKILNLTYSVGIYEPSTDLVNIKETHPVIVLNEQNIGEEFEFRDLLTKNEAFNTIDLQYNTIDSAVIELIKSCLHENVVYDAKLTNDQLNNDLNNISSTHGGILSGQKIISLGEVINDEKFLILQSLKNDYEKKLGSDTSFIWILIGQFIIISIIYSFCYCHGNSSLIYCRRVPHCGVSLKGYLVSKQHN